MTDLKFETIEAALALARKLEVAAMALRLLAAHPTILSLHAASPPLGAVFDGVPQFLKEARDEFCRDTLMNAAPTVPN